MYFPIENCDFPATAMFDYRLASEEDGTAVRPYITQPTTLEDGPPGRVCKWFVTSPPFISAMKKRPFGKGPITPGLGDLRSLWL